MSDLYFTADWLIDPNHVDYIRDHLFNNTDLPIFKFVARDITEEEAPEEVFSSLRFFVRVESEADLNEFIEKLASKIGLTVWKQVSEHEFSEGINPLEHPVPYLQEESFRNLKRSGKQNQVIRDKIEKGIIKAKPDKYDLPFRD